MKLQTAEPTKSAGVNLPAVRRNASRVGELPPGGRVLLHGRAGRKRLSLKRRK